MAYKKINIRIIHFIILKFKIFKIPIYILLPTLHAITIYYMVQFGCGDKNFGLFLLALILVAQCAFSLGI